MGRGLGIEFRLFYGWHLSSVVEDRSNCEGEAGVVMVCRGCRVGWGKEQKTEFEDSGN